MRGAPGIHIKQINYSFIYQLLIISSIITANLTSDAGYFVPNIYYYCASIIDFLANSYFIEQIYHAESFKQNISVPQFFSEIFLKMLKSLVQNSLHQTLLTLN